MRNDVPEMQEWEMFMEEGNADVNIEDGEQEFKDVEVQMDKKITRRCMPKAKEKEKEEDNVPSK